MTVKDIRFNIMELLDNTKDQIVLEAYYDILKNLIKIQQQQIIGYEIDGEPITKNNLDKKITVAQKNIEKGSFINHDDLKKDLQNW